MKLSGLRGTKWQELLNILARRIRLLFLDAKAAIEAAPMVAKVLARELNRDADWVQQQEKAFGSLAKNYLLHKNEDLCQKNTF